MKCLTFQELLASATCSASWHGKSLTSCRAGFELRISISQAVSPTRHMRCQKLQNLPKESLKLLDIYFAKVQRLLLSSFDACNDLGTWTSTTMLWRNQNWKPSDPPVLQALAQPVFFQSLWSAKFQFLTKNSGAGRFGQSARKWRSLGGDQCLKTLAGRKRLEVIKYDQMMGIPSNSSFQTGAFSLSLSLPLSYFSGIWEFELPQHKQQLPFCYHLVGETFHFGSASSALRAAPLQLIFWQPLRSNSALICLGKGTTFGQEIWDTFEILFQSQ